MDVNHFVQVLFSQIFGLFGSEGWIPVFKPKSDSVWLANSNWPRAWPTSLAACASVLEYSNCWDPIAPSEHDVKYCANAFSWFISFTNCFIAPSFESSETDIAISSSSLKYRGCMSPCSFGNPNRLAHWYSICCQLTGQLSTTVGFCSKYEICSEVANWYKTITVSYTHLTLPTIYSV